MKAVVLIAHGSKKESSNSEFKQMVNAIEQRSPYNFTKAAFLEIAEPSIQSVSKELISEGVKSICFYPYFLNSGKHVVSDIPEIIKQLQTEFECIEFKLLAHFGQSEKIHDIILEDIK